MQVKLKLNKQQSLSLSQKSSDESGKNGGASQEVGEEENELILASGELINSIDCEDSFWWIEDLDIDEWDDVFLKELPKELVSKETKETDCSHLQVVRLALKKRSTHLGIWSGVWKYELDMANREKESSPGVTSSQQP